MRTRILTGVVAACSFGFLSSASAQSFATAPLLDAPYHSVGPGEEVIVREREYIIRRRPILSDHVVYAPPVPVAPIPYARPAALVPAGAEVEPDDEVHGYDRGPYSGHPAYEAADICERWGLTVKRYHYDDHDQLRRHLADFLAAYYFARRLKTLKGHTPFEFVSKCWTSEPDHRAIRALRPSGWDLR